MHWISEHVCILKQSRQVTKGKVHHHLKKERERESERKNRSNKHLESEKMKLSLFLKHPVSVLCSSSSRHRFVVAFS